MSSRYAPCPAELSITSCFCVKIITFFLPCRTAAMWRYIRRFGWEIHKFTGSNQNTNISFWLSRRHATQTACKCSREYYIAVLWEIVPSRKQRKTEECINSYHNEIFETLALSPIIFGTFPQSVLPRSPFQNLIWVSFARTFGDFTKILKETT